MLNGPNGKSWRERRGSNPRPLPGETCPAMCASPTKTNEIRIMRALIPHHQQSGESEIKRNNPQFRCQEVSRKPGHSARRDDGGVRYLETKSKERGLFCKEVRFESEGGYSAPIALDAIFGYVVNPGVKKACLKVHSDIMTLGQDLEAVANGTHGIRYKCKNRLVGGLSLRRTFFYVWYRKDDDWPEFKLTAISDWAPRREKALKAMNKHYREFGGE